MMVDLMAQLCTSPSPVIIIFLHALAPRIFVADQNFRIWSGCNTNVIGLHFHHRTFCVHTLFYVCTYVHSVPFIVG